MIGHRIKEVRNLLGYSQTDFGARLGAGRGAIANYERGGANPSEIFLNHLCEVFGVSLDWLLKGEGDVFAPKNDDEELLKIVAEAIKNESEDIKEAIRLLGSLEKEHFDVMFNLLKIMSEKEKSR